MREIKFEVAENKKIARDIYRMTLIGDTSDITAPGQFVNIKLPYQYLRRPVSVCDYADGELTLIYKTVGAGTKFMSELSKGSNLLALTGLGNGYDIADAKNPVIIGGGVGVPPLYGLAKKLLEHNIKPSVILGFNSIEDCFYGNEFKALGFDVKIATMDGSYGTKGLVTDFIESCEYAYVCGPVPMLKAVYEKVQDGQFSFEARMACGFGVCMGCSIRTKNGFKRICADGPVLKYSEILWENS
ncbi:MAG: dihydroorotate dehydrogenase electron transfer subunit [Synergistaceae bacterium]|nr:dihydroorotate dehydrogenase electron transfer subunit [Synergistaceae bacterium]